MYNIKKLSYCSSNNPEKKKTIISVSTKILGKNNFEFTEINYILKRIQIL